MKRTYRSPSLCGLEPRGLTLVETLFAVVIVIVLILIAWPVVRGVGNISGLREAAKQVRDDISRTRIDSMASGRIYAIHFLPESNVYHIGPYEAYDPLLDATIQELEDPASRLADGRRWVGEPHEVAEDVSFELGDFQVPVAEETSKLLDWPVAPSGIGEGSAVMFYPDGTISDGMLLLRGPGDYFIEIRVRGNDGTVVVGNPYPSS